MSTGNREAVGAPAADSALEAAYGFGECPGAVGGDFGLEEIHAIPAHFDAHAAVALLPFEAASILLLVALMGAAMIVRRQKDA